MTDLLQNLVNSGHKIEPELCTNGWLEFDTVEDCEIQNKSATKVILDRLLPIGEVKQLQ